MTTTLIWLLVAISHQGDVTVVERFASGDECTMVAQTIIVSAPTRAYPGMRCIQANVLAGGKP